MGLCFLPLSSLLYIPDYFLSFLLGPCGPSGAASIDVPIVVSRLWISSFPGYPLQVVPSADPGEPDQQYYGEDQRYHRHNEACCQAEPNP